MNPTTSPLLLSLKPHYADMVFGGLKKAELRRRIASYIENRDVFVYVSSPRCEVKGGFRVGHVWKGTPDYVWEFVANLASMKKQEFDTYFCGCKVAFALEIKEVWQYDHPVHVSRLQSRLDQFVVPQSWRYLKQDEYEFLDELASGTRRFANTIEEDNGHAASSGNRH